MVEGKDAEKITTGRFFTSDGNAKDEDGGYYFRRADKVETDSRDVAQRVRHTPFQKTADTFRKNKLIRNTAICAVAALVIWGIASSNTPAGQQASDAIRGVIDYQTNLERDLGDLKFVDSVLQEDATQVSANEPQAQESGQVADASGTEDEHANTGDHSAQGNVADAAKPTDAPASASAAATDVSAQEGNNANFIYPLDGIVTTTFAESKSGVTITATDSTDVKSSKAGKVAQVSENYLSITNQDNSVSTYYGVAASVKKGDTVEAGQKIGKLLTQTLYVEQRLNGEKTDPLT